MMNIWQFNEMLLRRLLAWNIPNVAAGLWLLQRAGFWQGFGSQSIGWGFINLGIATVGRAVTRRRLAALDDPYVTDVMVKETRNLRRILWVNTGLDVLYMLGGWQFARTQGHHNQWRRGAGWGIVLQGWLLFVFDLIHAWLLSRDQIPMAETHEPEAAP